MKEEWYEEEGGYEYVSDRQGGKEGHAEAHIEPAVLYKPLGETSIEGSEHEQPEHGGTTHDASGDGGYCGGHWVKRSEKAADCLTSRRFLGSWRRVGNRPEDSQGAGAPSIFTRYAYDDAVGYLQLSLRGLQDLGRHGGEGMSNNPTNQDRRSTHA